QDARNADGIVLWKADKRAAVAGRLGGGLDSALDQFAHRFLPCRTEITMPGVVAPAPCALAVGDAEQAASRSKAASLSLLNHSRRPILFTTIIVDLRQPR